MFEIKEAAILFCTEIILDGIGLTTLGKYRDQG